jgi:hypothetical protein
MMVPGAVFAHRVGSRLLRLHSRLSRNAFLIVRFTAHSVRPQSCAQRPLRRRDRTLRAHIAAIFRTTAALLVLLATRIAAAQIELPQADPQSPIVIGAQHGQHWNEGSYDVWLLQGDCRIEQGRSRASSKEAVLWIDRTVPQGGTSHKVIAYLEGDVAIDQPSNQSRLEDKNWFGRLYSYTEPEVQVAHPQAEPAIKPPIYQHALAMLSPQPGTLQRTQFETTVPPETIAAPGQRLQVLPRSNVSPSLTTRFDAASYETILVAEGGVTVLIEGLPDVGGPLGVSGTIDVSTDRMVIWAGGSQPLDVSGQPSAGNNRPLELYMEGNIVFREGDRIVQAKAMYYNVTQRTGVILDAEVLSPIPRVQGLVRVKADVLRQVASNRYVADNGSFTTSRLGVPTYEFKSGQLVYEDTQVPAVNPLTGLPQVDANNVPIVDHEHLLSGQNNVITVEGIPVFYWPFFAADLQRPPLYVESIAYRNDQVFGNQLLVDLNPYQILGVRNPPKGTDWLVSLDYLSLRGFGGGTKFDYDRTGFFDWPGRYHGFIDAWAIDDRGTDNLGLLRRSITFPHSFRDRVLLRDEHELPNDWQLRLEVGQISDRNFLEEYYQQEWEEQKDQVTRLNLRRNFDNSSLELSASGLVNPFFMQTQNLPRLDHYWLGQSLLDDTLTWYEHSNIGYLRQNKLEQPTDPTDLFQFHFLPYDATGAGERVATRQEIDWPFQIGPVKVVPYGLGELADWGEDLAGERIQRAYGQAGVRASMPFWAVDPDIHSTLWNVNGIAHKVVLDVDFSFTDASKNVDQFILYDAIDDNNVQALRRRLGFEIYNDPTAGPTVFAVPQQFDERFYAVRRGVMDWVTGPTEIADDLTVIRLGADQRWQTKRGLPGEQHIIDWITLDTNLEIFPKPEQNFDQAAGLLDYDFHWFVGDRLTLMSYGAFDFFGGGQQWTTTGMFLNRPPRGSFYLGFNSFEGPISSEVITTSYTYRMTTKWLSSFGTSFDLKNQGNIGENFRLTRVGESFLFTMGFNVDVSRGNFGFNVAILPRFLNRATSIARGQIDVPPAGLYGLE